MTGYGHTAPTTFPLDLEAGLPRLKKVPIRLGSSWVEEEIRVETQHLERFTRYTLDFVPSVVAYYSHFADGVNHINWKAEAHGGNFFIGGLSSFDLEPGPAITMVMRFLDRQLGELMRRLPEDSTLVVVSDHGFDFRGYEHDNAPAGVIIIRGPDVRPGIITGASLIDVTPPCFTCWASKSPKTCWADRSKSRVRAAHSIAPRYSLLHTAPPKRRSMPIKWRQKAPRNTKTIFARWDMCSENMLSSRPFGGCPSMKPDCLTLVAVPRGVIRRAREQRIVPHLGTVLRSALPMPERQRFVGHQRCFDSRVSPPTCIHARRLLSVIGTIGRATRPTGRCAV